MVENVSQDALVQVEANDNEPHNSSQSIGNRQTDNSNKPTLHKEDQRSSKTYFQWVNDYPIWFCTVFTLGLLGALGIIMAALAGTHTIGAVHDGSTSSTPTDELGNRTSDGTSPVTGPLPTSTSFGANNLTWTPELGAFAKLDGGVEHRFGNRGQLQVWNNTGGVEQLIWASDAKVTTCSPQGTNLCTMDFAVSSNEQEICE
ncbi:MAG: hypothetical protein Q9159_000762 [Coniocarpon cinnabarinum]